MSRRSSRLHALERSVKGPRKSRAKARALTVMRPEGNTPSFQTGSRPARLPKDMEDQIAVIRGEAISKPSRGLLQLEDRLLRTRDVGPTSPVIQRYEHGAVPATATVLHQARALSMPVVNEFSGGYNVESFEETPAQRQTPSGSANNAATISAPLSPTTSEVAVPGCTDARRETPVSAVGPTSEPEPAARRPGFTPDQNAIAANFERDVAAMLSRPSAASAPEDRQWEETVRNAATAPPAASATSPAAPTTPEPPAAPKRDAHDVFNQMGLAMNYANSFDLGAMDLSARLDRFDEELALSSNTTPAVPVQVQALALDDFDLVADLAEISGAQSAPAPSAVEPAANESCP